MELGEPVEWAPGMSLLADVDPAAWIGEALAPAARSGTVAAMVPPVFAAYARVLPPAHDPAGGPPHRWSEIAAHAGVPLTAGTHFDDLAAGSLDWGRPGEGRLDARETKALARLLTGFTGTPERAFYCVWEGFGLDEIDAWMNRPMRVQTPDRAYHLLTGPVGAAPVLPATVEWRCASLWWPADRSWLVATEIDGYLTYVGGSQVAIDALLAAPDLDAVPVQPSTPLDPSHG